MIDLEKEQELSMRKHKKNCAPWIRKGTMKRDKPLWMVTVPVLSTTAPPFKNALDLWRAAEAYFDWAANNPVEIPNNVEFRGVKSTYYEERPRAFTMRGFATYCGCSLKKLEALSNDPQFEEVLAIVNQVIYTQQYEYAAVNVMNANLIARSLDISEKLDIGGGKTPIKTVDVGKLSLAAMEEILNAQKEDE